MTARLRVAVLFGGRSGEHEVSLRSAESVAEGLAERHEVLCVLIDKAGRWLLQTGPRPEATGGEPVFLAPSPDDGGRLRRLADATELARPDVFFPVLHGPYGEDGTVQGLFELAAVPYVGAGVAASAASMDKAMMKALFAQAGLPQVEHRVLFGRDPAAEARVLDELGLPVFVKPANLGSSVAVAKVETAEALGAALDAAFAYDRKVVVEQGVDAREIEVSVLGNDDPEASVPGEIVPDREFYDYDSKYSADSRTELRDPGAPRRRHDAGDQEARRSPPSGPSTLAGSRGSTSSWSGRTGGCSSTRSTPCPASPPSACTRACGRPRACPSPSCWTASSASPSSATPRAPGSAPTTGAERGGRGRPPVGRPRPRGGRSPDRGSARAGARPQEVGHPADPEYRAALGLVYDGDFAAAEARLATLSAAHPDDPVGPYLQALALEWRLEQQAPDVSLDRAMLALADRAVARADARLQRDAGDARALMARGAAHGVKSRHHLFRWQRAPARREAVRMRADLLGARARGAEVSDLDFGLGLYDYYVDILPRFFKLLRVVARIPGGDRERGLDAIARVARGGSLFHDDEACAQMSDIQSYFEGRPDGALHWTRRMWQRHRGWPLWGLKLARVLRDLGLFDESGQVAREILTTAEKGRHDNYQPVVGAMARVILGEALLLDLRLAAAREAARPAAGGDPGADWVGPRASLVVAQSLDLEGDHAAALPHYRRAASGRDNASARKARERLDSPLTPRERLAWQHLARARRLSEVGREGEAHSSCLEALRADPSNAEARVCTAERSLRMGDRTSARALLRGVVEDPATPLWIRTRGRLALARALEAGDRQEALRLYKEVWNEPSGRPELRGEAAAAIARLDPGTTLPPAPRWEQ